MSLHLIYDPVFLTHDTGAHPENPMRLEVILRALEGDAKLAGHIRRVAPRGATDEDLTGCHGEEVILQARAISEEGGGLIDMDTVVSRASYEVARLAAGAGITAVDAAFTEDGGRAFALVRPPGHHATERQSMGFCLFNNA